jgi:hypothetical protein
VAEQQASGNPALEKQANDRLKDARNGKALWLQDFKECYFFTAPQRQRYVTSETQPPTAPLHDEGELNTTIPALLAQDFVTEVVNTYMPEAQQWCERGRGMFVPPDAWEKIKDQVAKDDKVIFDAMKASNLYSEIQKAFFPDLSIGTCGLWIDRPTLHGSIAVKAIPLREIECALGPDGAIDDRWAIRYTKNCYVRALLPGIDLPEAVAKEIADNPARKTEIRWGFWRLWDRHDDEVWQAVVLIKNALVDSRVLIGEGSCPMEVPRFNPSADWPWGLGPTLTGLPEFRQIDELDNMRIRNIDLHLAPPFSYPDDSFAAIEQGLESGFGYPIKNGSQDAIKAIYQPGPPDAANYLYEDKEHRLRKSHYVDFPEQTGDTPPTLGQWLDEMARAQRRIGGPGASFYREGPARIFLRFKFLLEAAGTIKPVKVDGKNVSLLPYNPAQRAAEQQEIATNVQALQILSQIFPEEFKVRVGGGETIIAILDKMRAKLVKLRDPKEIDAALKQIAPLIKGHLGVGAPGQGAGAPASQPQLGP